MEKVGIIGGGPAGLAAAMALHEAGLAFELFDAGPPLSARRHDRAEHLGLGIGGAGLFSDGKFSFYPSGTKLYELAHTARLRHSYHAVADVITSAGIDAPPFPDLDWNQPSDIGFTRKEYRSSYGTLAERIRLVEGLSRGAEASITTQAKVLRIARGGQGYTLHVDVGGEVRQAGPFSRLILATGRFGSTALESMIEGGLPLNEQRYEVGIRLEHPEQLGFLRHSSSPDVKFILRESEVEVRTFCTCRRGEVWMIPYDGVSALSGRSDGPPSSYCNFGLLPRFTGDRCGAGREVLDQYQAAASAAGSALWQSLPEFLDGRSDDMPGPTLEGRPWHPRSAFVAGDIAGALHPELRAILRGSLRAIVERYPDLYSPESVCLFPAIEGVGSFPDTDGDMRVAGESIWCCGDVVGRFRGLTPALVSGHYAGSAVAEHIETTAAAAAGATLAYARA